MLPTHIACISPIGFVSFQTYLHIASIFSRISLLIIEISSIISTDAAFILFFLVKKYSSPSLSYKCFICSIEYRPSKSPNVLCNVCPPNLRNGRDEIPVDEHIITFFLRLMNELMICFVTYVFPVPGPPVSRKLEPFKARHIAYFWSTFIMASEC